MLEVYIYGCKCGLNGTYLRKLKRYAKDHDLELTVHESKYNPNRHAEHIKLLKDNGFVADKLLSIVLYNGTVTRLDKWQF